MLKQLIRFTNRSFTSIVKTEMDTKKASNIVWIDMEMTGLDPETCHILEVACLITNSKLDIISDNFDVVINQPSTILENMSEWCMNQHSKTGLINESYKSIITIEDAENQLLEFIKKYVPEGKCPIAGNTVYMDRIFLRKYMPHVNEYIHYRIIDVSTIKELAKRWNVDVYQLGITKNLNHRALSDIKESIEELKIYKKHIFKITD
ncbi:uncharacterized protein LOC107262926 isoform X2 [Cephus cinctus]|nr:uncharacterized protein LOC107262926 isoform X2 [Cephus cinctus]XP_024936087.1 uncharacterized protein LOC107262926 isoform X2 [Cephus cinctus]